VVSTAAGPLVPTSRRRTLPVVFTLSIPPALQQIPSCTPAKWGCADRNSSTGTSDQSHMASIP
jgi:hypothetical protein